MYNQYIMTNIYLLKEHPEYIPPMVSLWHEVLGKIWMPEISIQQIESCYQSWLNSHIPLAYVALNNGIPVGSCSLQLNDGIRPDLKPWLGDLIVDPKYQGQGIGKMLINTAATKAKELGFEKLHLFTFDSNIEKLYKKLGWVKIAMDEFQGRVVIVMEREL
jgi:GNAT superfamily N-acetyltransferase